MKSFRFAAALVFVITMAGCRAHMVMIKLVNTSAAQLSTIIVDYPSATFGKDKLAPSETFSSPVKITDDGALKVRRDAFKRQPDLHTLRLLPVRARLFRALLNHRRRLRIVIAQFGHIRERRQLIDKPKH